MLGGGVAANNELRKQFKKACLKNKFKCLIPDVKYCTDNAAMVAITAYYHWLKRERKVYPKIKADANSRIN
jgi:N6-L-threonylcarbamoyladenine synthase